jgi:hypothetical protein
MMDPQAALGLVANPEIAPIAADARQRLQKALAEIMQIR